MNIQHRFPCCSEWLNLLAKNHSWCRHFIRSRFLVTEETCIFKKNIICNCFTSAEGRNWEKRSGTRCYCRGSGSNSDTPPTGKTRKIRAINQITSLCWNNELQTNEKTNETLGNKLYLLFSCCLSQFVFVCNSITLTVFIHSFWQSLKLNLFYFLSDIFAPVCHSLFVYYRWPKCAALILLLIYYGLCRVMWRVRCPSPSECTASDKL